jgi:hypothetical protein
MDARLQLFVMWLFDQVWDREKQTFWMPSGRDGLLSIRNRERLLTYYGPGSLAVDPGVSETSGLFVSVEAQQRAANVQENFLAQELLDAETSLADSVRAASMHRALFDRQQLITVTKRLLPEMTCPLMRMCPLTTDQVMLCLL